LFAVQKKSRAGGNHSKRPNRGGPQKLADLLAEKSGDKKKLGAGSIGFGGGGKQTSTSECGDTTLSQRRGGCCPTNAEERNEVRVKPCGKKQGRGGGGKAGGGKKKWPMKTTKIVMKKRDPWKRGHTRLEGLMEDRKRGRKG